MNLELDNINHKWILHYHNLKREISYSIRNYGSLESELEKMKLELIEEFRDEQIKKILNNEEDIK